MSGTDINAGLKSKKCTVCTKIQRVLPQQKTCLGTPNCDGTLTDFSKKKAVPYRKRKSRSRGHLQTM